MGGWEGAISGGGRRAARRGPAWEVLSGSFEEAGEGLVFRRAQFVEAEAEGARVFAEAEGAEEAIPEGEEGGIVRIGLGLPGGVVDLVHEGGDDEEAEAAIHGGGEADVGVVELDDGKHGGLVEGELPEREAQEGDDGDAQGAGEEDFAKMEPAGGGDIHAGIGMMDAMEAPEKRHAVVEAVPGVHPEVEEEKDAGEMGPGGKLQPVREDVEEAEAMGFGPAGDGPPEGDGEGGGKGGIEDAEGEIAQGVDGALPGGGGEEGEEGGEGFPGEEGQQERGAGGAAEQAAGFRIHHVFRARERAAAEAPARPTLASSSPPACLSGTPGQRRCGWNVRVLG